MHSFQLLTFAFLPILLWSHAACSHGALADRPNSSVLTTASTTLRSDHSVEQGQPGLIVGAQLGGEALPVEKGLSIDDLQLIGTWAPSQNYAIQSSMMAHFYQGNAELELESFLLMLYPTLFKLEFTLAAGKVTAQATPSAYWHASQSQFSEAPLLADVFWGRHFADTGLQISKRIKNLNLGVELWNGNSWPASGGEGAADLYLHYNSNWQSIYITGGIWAFTSKAENRSDTRYGAGHSHGNQTIINPVADYFFDGDTVASGFFTDVSLPFGKCNINVQFEVITQTHKGQLSNTNQAGELEANNLGYRAGLALALGQHNLVVNYEKIALENEFYNVPEIFVKGSGLFNNGFEPRKINLLWSYQWQPEIIFRSEFIVDKSYSEAKESRFNIGFTWSQHWEF